MANLRPYQHKAITQLYDWFERNPTGNPCIVLPTGSGKSHIIAHLCHDMLTTWPETRVLMLTHQKELIEQNAEKLLAVWPDAPLGIYSASVGRKDLDQITFAGIQSVRRQAKTVGHVDIVMIDECHLVSHHDTGSYRKLLAELKEINPALRVVGLTATPYRLGHGSITDEPAIFSDLIEPTSVLDLVQANYLSPLRSKMTHYSYELDGLHKRGGDYIEKELAERINTDGQNVEVVDEIINRGRDRRTWLVFCSGVEHAYAVADRLRNRGISAETITGETPKATRESLLSDFRAGRLRALTNANCLTTGVDVPGIDLIALLRPTASPGLYVQMVGRGMRLAEGKSDCLVLDFAGAVKAHGPITDVRPPGKAGQGEAPLKACPECNELLHLSVMHCIACGYEFPPPPKPKPKLHDDDIMRIAPFQMRVTDWRWDKHISRTSGLEMLRISYYSGLTNDPVREYMPVRHEGYAGRKAVETVAILARSAGADVFEIDDLTELAQVLSRSTPPAIVEYKRDGKFHKVVRRIWNVTLTSSAA